MGFLPNKIRKNPQKFSSPQTGGVKEVMVGTVTLGIVKIYHSKLARRDPRSVRAGSAGLDSIATLPTHWHPARGTLDWERTRGLIQTSWTASATLSSLALTVDTAFVQLIATCTDEFFKTVALSALIFLFASLACGVIYTGYKDSIAGSGRELEWQAATASDSSFWMLMALPALFLAWAFACSILAVLYLSFSASCAGPCQSDACGTAIGMPLLISRLFFALVVAASLGLVCFATRTVRGHAMQ
ncbi:hypothetical protein HYPSUDRAFT_323825 [Hypholoma sublateritium FD-334 SS-4]|uniref:Uncharacterized protein n=1 Tax=Hypholoma sublateritium (strain FD-334 SS-4) TaxID=945553 RepID=A0A0D2P6Q8_HYPSF|nr:hypothetical protein HYPSUDRAFT_323825 [Hypholoma sublateritium FD-334 SS-4]